MWQNLRLTAGARPRKSAAIVGEVLGKYHPHGDQAAYEAMVRMAQDFSLRYPLVHGEGNFGSLDGDGAAAYRYTEAKLTAVAEELLEDLGADTVPFRATFDAMLDEPIVLPSAIPQLLMNGSTGIAVGMATNIPPHNLREIVAALTAMIDEPDIAVKDLLKHVKGPDFPTGGEILNGKRELREIYENGQGPIRLRGEYTVETLARGKRQVIVTSIPYTVNKAELVEAIANEIIARKLPLVVDVRDESTTDVRIVLELKAEASAEAAMAYLYKHTPLQTNFAVNTVALVDGVPRTLNLRDALVAYIDHQVEVVTRRSQFRLEKARNRAHIVEGLLKAIDMIDAIINAIRASENKAAAQVALEAAPFEFSDVQADHILEMPLHRLTRLGRTNLEEEMAKLRETIAELEAILGDEVKLRAVIREELGEVRDEYATARVSQITYDIGDLDIEDLIDDEDLVVTMTAKGYIKTIAVDGVGRVAFLLAILIR
jgi:DNA gyrase subunit A